MWVLTCILLFAAGYATSIYSWSAIKVWINRVAAEAERLRERVTRLKAKLRDI